MMQSPVEQTKDRLSQAVENAELLVEFASRNGKNLSVPLINSVTKARHLLEQHLLKGEEEANFYAAYNLVAKALGKVTVGSIKDSREEFGIAKKRYFLLGASQLISKANLTVRSFRRAAVFALALLIAVQIFWLWGTTLLDSLDQAYRTRLDVRAKLGTPSENLATVADKERLRLELSNLDERIVIYDRSLASWGWPWISNAAVAPPGQTTAPRDFYSNSLTRKLQAENCCKMLQSFFLPLLYGWVGALTYVLRQLIESMRDRTFTYEGRSSFTLRVFLGVIAGLAIGWFFQPEDSRQFIKNATPFTLSFLAGYGVEVLYSAMDKLVNAFGSLSQASKG